ncbi:hypothetical protein GCM10022285_34640 [Streptomyces tunisiensis]|uniref:Tyr recombinase domain-containing protein n=1 Tax=Streptomyces tunisiensis TaxID=948699 RepID=A0ABP7YLF9_9ACTN
MTLVTDEADRCWCSIYSPSTRAGRAFHTTEVGGEGLAGGLPGLGSSMIRGPYAGWQLGQALKLPAMCSSGPLVLLDAGPGPGRWLKPWSRPAPATAGYSLPRARCRQRAAGRGRPGRRQEAGRAAEAARARAVRGLDGTAAAAETVRRKRRTLVNALHYAVDLGEFKENPITGIRWKKPKVAGEVDPRVVANPAQARALLTAVSYVGGYGRARGRRLVGLFACMYYGALRPADAVGLTDADLKLPETGWGTVLLNRTRPSVGKQWTDSGETHDDRGLKNRPAEEIRLVPIPPQLVAIFRQHLETFGTAEDGRLFANERGGVVGSSTYYRVWQEARALALPPAAVASPLAARPYDLRHSALSTWLNSGVDPTEVAERAGNSVEVLLSRYAKCIDGRQEIVNRKIEELLREYE